MVSVFWIGTSDLPLAYGCIVLLWPAGFLKVNALVWINVPNWISPAVWHQWKWLKLYYRSPCILAIVGIGRNPSFQILRKTWSLGFICVRTAPSSVFLVGVGSALEAQYWIAFWPCPRLIIYLRAWLMSSSSRKSVVRKGLHWSFQMDWASDHSWGYMDPEVYNRKQVGPGLWASWQSFTMVFFKVWFIFFTFPEDWAYQEVCTCS